ncbi:MAG TPA: type I methionyl aminopeptidase [Thermomicrobiales bacterium]|nr:type I methionyl aminopeptidase [Thermomicrobiales bacterium]
MNLKNEKQIALMRESGRAVAHILDLLEEQVRPGVTTAELDAFVEAQIREAGGVSSFNGYHGFTGNICVAVNDEVVHGIPGPRVLRDGDIIAIDVGIILNGWHGDSCRTYAVGSIDDESRRLMQVCEASLQLGIEHALEGNRLTDISYAIEQHVIAAGFSVVRDLFGHGIGRRMHEAPSLPHYGPPGDGPVLRSGLVFTIEPMIVAGSRKVKTLGDGWTIVTLDGSRSAQYEHTVAISNGRPHVLTLP